ncbi:hypothetical protein [Actinoallomurus oryzae]
MSDHPLSPQDTLRAAESAHAAAAASSAPRWYPATSLALFTGAVAVAGVAAFTDGAFRRIGSVTGIGLFAVWVVVSLAVWRVWRRRGVIPRDAASPGLLASLPRVRRIVTVPLLVLAVVALVLGLAGHDWALGAASLFSALSVLLCGFRRAPR